MPSHVQGGPTRRGRLWPIVMLLLLLLALLAGCGSATDRAAGGLLGRWQRISPAGPGDPNETSAEYLEFRERGELLDLLKDEGSGKFWLTNSATYSLVTAGELEVSGTCWQGWTPYACSRTYRIVLKGDSLKMTGDRQAEYRRIGGLSADWPPTLAPPFPSPTPVTQG